MDIDLDQARRRAKELLRAARDGDPEALARLRADRTPRLADAQRAVAAELGQPSWPALVAHVDATQGDRGARRARLVRACFDGRLTVAQRLLDHDPALARAGLDTALVVGDAEAVAAALDRDPALLAREVPGTEHRRPLSCACHTHALRPDSPWVEGARATVRLLLDRGADPNETFMNEFGPMSALYGAAGVVHDPVTTALLLDRGASPDDGESLYHAVESPDTACLELLLRAGATVRGTNALGNALRWPAHVRALLELGDLPHGDPELGGLLLHAVVDEVVEMLIAHGAPLDVRDADGLGVYARAVRRADTSLMALLARAGAPTDVDPVARWLGALVDGDTDGAAALLAADPALPERMTRADRELLPMMASGGQDAIVARLIDAGLPLDARGIDQGTALHYAGGWGRASTVRLLLERGAELELMAGPRGAPSTPLGWTAWGSRGFPGAAERLDGYVEAAEILVAAGAVVRQGMVEVAADEVAVVLEEALRAQAASSPLAAARAGWGERGEGVFDSGLEFAPGVPVLVRVRKRGNRYDIDDAGAAVAAAGTLPGWRAAAEAAVGELALNLSRSGTVFVQALEGRDVEGLVARTAQASLAVHRAILDLEG